VHTELFVGLLHDLQGVCVTFRAVVVFERTLGAIQRGDIRAAAQVVVRHVILIFRQSVPQEHHALFCIRRVNAGRITFYEAP